MDVATELSLLSWQTFELQKKTYTNYWMNESVVSGPWRLIHWQKANKTLSLPIVTLIFERNPHPSFAVEQVEQLPFKGN